MKKTLIAVLALLFVLFIGGAIYYLSIPKSGIKLIELNERTIEYLRKDIYDYDLGIVEGLKKEDIKVVLIDEESTYEIFTEQALLLVGDKFTVVYKNKDGSEKVYTFTLVDDLTSNYLTRNVDQCVDDLNCNIDLDETKVNFEVFKNKLRVKVNGKGSLQLEPVNYRILSLTKLGSGVAFLHSNIVDIDDITLYVLDNAGKVIFNEKVLDEELNIKPYSIIGFGDNELVIRGNRVYLGFSLKDDDNYIPMCEANRSDVAQIDYSLFYRDDNTVSDLQENERYTVNDYILDKTLQEQMDPCSTEGFE
jgi:hypothetical protein